MDFFQQANLFYIIHFHESCQLIRPNYSFQLGIAHLFRVSSLTTIYLTGVGLGLVTFGSFDSLFVLSTVRNATHDYSLPWFSPFVNITNLKPTLLSVPYPKFLLFSWVWSQATSNELLITHRLIECIRGNPRAPYSGGLISSMLSFTWLITSLLHQSLRYDLSVMYLI